MSLSYENFLTRLACGQLKNTSAVDDSVDGFIKEEYAHVVLSLTNQGLTDITTRKKVFEESNIIYLNEDKNLYNLDTSPEGDYHRMVRVYEVIGKNDIRYTPKTSVDFTMPSFDIIRFSDNFIRDNKPEVTVMFQKTHSEVNNKAYLHLPEHLYEALILYVSALFLSHMGGEEHTAKGDAYYALYLRLLSEDQFNNASGISEIMDQDYRFIERGYV